MSFYRTIGPLVLIAVDKIILNLHVIRTYIEDITRVVISYEINQTSLWRV